jgi:hypothetical protein
LWTLAADGAYSTVTALPRIRRDMRSASRSASRDSGSDGSGSDGSGSDGSGSDGSGSDGSGSDGSGSDGSGSDGSDDGSDDVTRAFAAGVKCSRQTLQIRDRSFERLRGVAIARAIARRERQARVQARNRRMQVGSHLQTPPPATTGAGSSSAGKTAKRQKITRSGCSF